MPLLSLAPMTIGATFGERFPDLWREENPTPVSALAPETDAKAINTLILPAIAAVSGPRRAAIGVVAAVTGLTGAHALTLCAAATELLRPPTALIEVLIALSIVVTAADNVRPFIPAPSSVVAAFFGLIHGFGFATALGALNLTGGTLAVAIVGFNLGLETAQVAVVILALPVLYLLGGGRLKLLVGSAAAGAVGLWWLLTRLPTVLG